jgi:hypothetical protein
MQDRNRSERYCPRGCGYRLLKEYNPKSDVDGLQICSSCRTAEIIDALLKGNNNG